MRAGLAKSSSPQMHHLDDADPAVIAYIVAGSFAAVGFFGLIMWSYSRQLAHKGDAERAPMIVHDDDEDTDVPVALGEAVSGAVSDPDDEDVPPLPAAPEPPPAVPPPGPLELPPGPLELRRDEREARHCWTQLPARAFTVRGATYLKDGAQEPSGPAASELLCVELFRSSSAVYDVAGRAGSPVATLQRRTRSALSGTAFVANLLLPADDGFFQLVLYFGLLAHPAEAAPAARLLQRFLEGGDRFRGARLRLQPEVAEGPRAVRQAVGRPAVLGQALRQRFSRGEGYLEVGVDCNSSPAAGKIVSLVKSHAAAVVVDLAFVIEAQAAEELAERVLGCGRIAHVDLGGELPEWGAAAV